MLKKILTAVGLAGVLILGGSAAALADYPAGVTCTASPAVIAPGGTSTVACTGFVPGSFVEVTASGGSVSAPDNADDSGNVSASFTADAVGSYTVTASSTDAQEVPVSGSVTITVEAPSNGGGGGGGGGGLPPTGGTVPTAAIWLGIGAIAIGGIAVTAVAVRRRASSGD
jgi:hypothetical protein